MGQAVIVLIFSTLWIVSGTLTAIITGLIWGELIFLTSQSAVIIGWWKSVRKIMKEYRALTL
ncbi:hypothetical protein [Shewanella sp. UCD-KL12]|uniref:hypothetical protein n=1 Tax=Shewanella sp. UCD-KL12 TaxID=1917163 RepID=UPI0009713998|nr:hypothetical protein [Shewanella sp. UCD-KL12]